MSSTSGADDLFGQGWGAGARPVPTAPSLPESESDTGWDPLGPSGGSAPTFRVVGPPLEWLYVAAGIGVVALVLAIALWGVIPAAIASWVLGGPVLIAATSVFHSIDTARRTQIGYSTGSRLLTGALYTGALVLGLSAVVVAGIDLALWAGRGF